MKVAPTIIIITHYPSMDINSVGLRRSANNEAHAPAIGKDEETLEREWIRALRPAKITRIVYSVDVPIDPAKSVLGESRAGEKKAAIRMERSVRSK